MILKFRGSVGWNLPALEFRIVTPTYAHMHTHRNTVRTQFEAATRKKKKNFKHGYSVVPWVSTTSKAFSVMQQAAGIVAKKIQ